MVDPGGAVVGMWQPGEHRGGVVGEVGAPCHFELHTRDYDDSVAFYEEVFGWVTRVEADTPGFRYAVLPVADGENAGIMDAGPIGFLPEGEPARWSVYFAVEDVHDALPRVAELGGAVVDGPEDTPYGRLATVTDSNGARFNLRSEVPGA